MAKNINELHQDSLRWHERLAKRITGFIGTMLCAALFAVLALLMLPNALAGGVPTFIPWLAQTFLQLVLLSIIMVGQNLEQRHAELLAEKDYEVDIATEKEILAIQDKLDLLIEEVERIEKKTNL